MILLPLPGRAWRKTQGFGGNKDTYEEFGMHGHNGYDFAPLIPGSKGVIVYAPHDGYATLGDEGDSGYGRYISLVSDPYGHNKLQRRSDLAHLEAFLVDPKQFVHQGDPVGIMGSTGFSTGIHLHWTYKRVRNGVTLDYDNGFKGAFDIGRFTLVWGPKHIG